MRANTIITLGASAAFGIVAVVLARGWINSAVEDEFRQTKPGVVTTLMPTKQTFPVVVLQADLSFGNELTPEALKIVNYQEDAVPYGSFSSIEDIFPEPGARTVVLTQIRANEPVMDYKISGPGGKGSLSAIISPGYRAAAIRVDDVTGVGGFIVPGDFIDIIYTRDPDTRRNGANLISDVLLQQVKVLGIDQNLSDETAEPDLAKTVTVEVTNEDAQKLHLALDTGKLSITLRAAGETDFAPAKTLNAKNLTNAKSGTSTRRKARTKQAKKPDPTAQVTVIRGDERDQVSVLRETEKSELAGG